MERIERAILILRGHTLRLDSELSALYGVQPKVLNQADRRNLGRFPDDFMFGEFGDSRSCPAGYKENAGILCHNNPLVMIAETVFDRGDRAFKLQNIPLASEPAGGGDSGRCSP